MSFVTQTYSRKVRCQDCDDEENCNIMPVPKLYMKNRTSSMMANILGSKHIFATSISQQTPEAILKKGSGNIQKQGSGGNSYNTYIMKKKGMISCNCDVAK